MVAVIMQMINMTTIGGKELNPPNWSTSHLDSPEILDEKVKHTAEFQKLPAADNCYQHKSRNRL